jgi:SAM-dependent methyltransferase
MSFRYYRADTKLDPEVLRRSIEGCLELGKERLNPSLSDVDSLIFLQRTPIFAQWLAELPEDIIGNAENLPIRDDSCDVVLCTDTLQYVPDAAAAVREMHRVLRPGGKLILSTRGCYPEHHDEIWRFLPDGLRYLCRMFLTVQVVPEGHSASGLMISLNVLLHRRIRSARIRSATARTTIPLLNRLGLLLDRVTGNDSRSTCGLSTLAVK